jgi:prepilin peptidase CpaA
VFGQTNITLYAITAVSLIAFGTGIGNSLLGAASGLLFYGWIFALGFIGGGDVKFLMALGAWGGFKFAGQVALLSILLGGVMAVGVLLYKKRAFDFFLRMQLFVSSLFVQEMKAQKPEIDKNLQMPFGIPMAVAALLLAWGVPVWPI